jgi:uncharacterized protein (DUF849 family)
MLRQSFLLGGHVRIGMEDTVYSARASSRPSNAKLVEKAVGIVESLGGRIATLAEARGILGIDRVSNR